MKNFLPLLLLALGLLCGFSGCSNADFLGEGLKIELIYIAQAGDGSVQVSWRVDNPNIFPYLFSKTSSNLSINGVLVGTVTDTSPLGVPAQDHAERTGTLKLAKPLSRAAVDRAIAAGTVAYRMDSAVTVLLLDDKFEIVHLSNSGSITIAAK